MDTRDFNSLIAFGANLPSAVGSPRDTILCALEILAHEGLGIVSVSRIHESPAFPAGSGPAYLNGALCVRTGYPPERVLEALHSTEAALGRVRGQRWGPRAIDLDLIAHEDAVRPGPAVQDAWRSLSLARQMELRPVVPVLPHPRMQDRAFVLKPLLEIAPGWRHPRTGLSVREMAGRLDPAEMEAVRPVE